MENMITVKISDWLFNCGILGLYNILTYQNNEKDIYISQDELKFPISKLDGFSDKYFHYLIDTYEKTFSIYRITSFKDFLDNHNNSEFKNFSDKSLEKLNSQIEITKTYIKSQSYISAYQMIKSDFEPLKIEKELKKITLKKKEIISDKLGDIKYQMKLLYEVVSFFEMEDVKKYVGGKNTMYSVIRNAWDKVSIMNAQNKNPDMYEEIENYFVEPVKEYVVVSDKEKEKFKYQCISCNSKIKDLKIDLGFMRGVGFDVNRKTSHVWDFNNYVAICPVCRLVYSCVPAGFSYLYNRGIFVNFSMDLQELARINNNIRKEIIKNSDQNTIIYRALQQQMDKTYNENSSYELSDVQVVRFDRDINKDSIFYTFSIINKPILITVQKCNLEFERIRNAYFIEGKDTLYLYNEVMKRLLNNENQFLLIQKLIYYKLSTPDKVKYSLSRVKDILKINVEFLKETGYMSKDDKDIIKTAKNYGYYLQKSYDTSSEDSKKSSTSDKYNKKLDGIAYRMLNALKTNNKHAFMDILINAHMYVQKPVPSIFAKYLDKELEFKNIGYAFVTGMIGYSGNTEENIEDSENNKDKGEN